MQHNILKTLALVGLAILVGCSSTSSTTSGLSASGGTVQLVGWTTGTGTFTFLAGTQTLASGVISSTGGFSYQLATPITLNAVVSPTGCTISPADVKVVDASVSFKKSAGNAVQIRISTASPSVTRSFVGDGLVGFIEFADRDYTIKGACLGSNSLNLSLKKGWNWLWSEVTSVSSSGTPTGAILRSGTNLPSNFKWYVIP